MDEIRGSRPLYQRRHLFRCIKRRIGIGHHDDGGETSPGRSLAAGGHRFRSLVSGLTQMHMKIDETGHRHKPFCLNHYRIWRQAGGDWSHDTIPDKQVANLLGSGRRIEDPGPLNKEKCTHNFTYTIPLA